MVSSQSSMTAATLGAGGLVNPSFQYSWAINCAEAQTFNPGSSSSISTINPAVFGAAANYNGYTVTQTAGDNGGWTFSQDSRIDGGYFWVIYWDRACTSGISGEMVDGVISPTNKYATIDMTWNGIGDNSTTTLSNFADRQPLNGASLWHGLYFNSDASEGGFDIAGVAEMPISHLNGTQISTSGGSVIDPLRNSWTGFLKDGSDILNNRVCLTFDLSRDSNFTTHNDDYNPDRFGFYMFNHGSAGSIFPANFTIHSLILGPEPPPQLVTQLDVSNPV